MARRPSIWRRGDEPATPQQEARERGPVGPQQRGTDEVGAREDDLERVRREEADKRAELERGKGELERELEATLRRLEQASERAAAAERRVSEIELESARGVKRGRKAEAETGEADAGGGDPINLATASFEDLRSLGLSVTQSKRVLDHRESAGFDSVDDLDRLPGFATDQLARVKRRLTL